MPDDFSSIVRLPEDSDVIVLSDAAVLMEQQAPVGADGDSGETPPR